MFFGRLLALVAVGAVYSGMAFAQSPLPSETSDLVVFNGAASLNVGAAPIEISGPDVSNPAREKDESSPALIAENQAGRFSREPGMALGPDSDTTCYYIRDYVVVRESPHSDVTHRDGSSTCVPAARFRVFRTGGQGR